MFVRPRDPELETWDGRRAGVEGAKERYGADAAYPASELPQRLPELLANREELHYALGLDDEMDLLVAGAIARLRKTEKQGQAAAARGHRSARRAARAAAAQAARGARRAAQGRRDHVRRAPRRDGAPAGPACSSTSSRPSINYTFRRRGGHGPGYTTIVGAGENATILHYIENRCAIADGDLVLVDAGCEYDHYTADITRTWPASGRFTPAQRQVYELVLATQKEAIAMAVARRHDRQLHEHCVRRLTEGMIALGLLEGPADARIADQGYKKFYMHGTSHWLGLDVHDVGAYTPGRQGAPARARHGHHRRARPLHRRRRRRRPGAAARHRRADRGRSS